MRSAEIALAIIHERGKKGLPLEGLYRQLYNPSLYLLAYGRIYRNVGAMTPGATEETADGMSLAKIGKLIDALRHERYRWTPARRVYIEKKGSKKMRPLGIPCWSDKLLQEVIRLLLDAYYDPQFSPASNGFRPKLGCHTALREVYHKWVGTKWFIEGDIAQCFDTLDHGILLSILREKIHDNRFLRLIDSLLRTGYLEDWRYNATLSGSPQGAVLSPILSNIYLDKLDQFVVQSLLPRYTRGDRRRPNPVWQRLQQAARKLQKLGNQDEARRLRRQMQQVSSLDPTDSDYRRLRYVRYADDCAPRRREGVFSALITSEQPCCTRDEGRPLNPDYRIWVQTTGCCFGPMAEVVSESGKGRARPCQVRVEKTSESKPPMNRRKRRNDVKTRWQSLVWDQLGGNLFTVQAASGGRGGVSSMQALVWNVGTCVSMPREQLKRTTRESLSTEARHRGGVVRSSDEGSVTEPERRGDIVQPDWKINRKREESFG